MPGDLVFTSAQGGGFFSRQIQFWTRTWFEPPTRASHVAVVVEPSEVLADTLIVEQTWPRIRRTVLGTYAESGFYVFRDLRLMPEDRAAIAANALRAAADSEADDRVGEHTYGVGKILLFLADAAIGKVISFPWVVLGLCLGRRWKGYEPVILRRIDLTGTVVCSQFAARLWWDPPVEIHLGDHWVSRSPDDLSDYFETRPDRFVPVCAQTPPGGGIGLVKSSSHRGA